VHEERYKHTLDAARTIYRTEGISAFYRGLLPSLLGIVHVAIQFPLYERLKMFARKSSGLPSMFYSITFLLILAKFGFMNAP
jgi:solute carrier family 25 (mitochondrial folate transporter), member 32